MICAQKNYPQKELFSNKLWLVVLSFSVYKETVDQI